MKNDYIVVYTGKGTIHLCERLISVNRIYLVVLGNQLTEEDFVQIEKIKQNTFTTVIYFEVKINAGQSCELEIPDELLRKFSALYTSGVKMIELPDGNSAPYTLVALVIAVRYALEQSMDCIYWRVYTEPTKQLNNICAEITRLAIGKVLIQPVVFSFEE